MKNDAPIRYRIQPVNPEAHLYEVSCTVAAPDPEGQRFSLPAWIPGSYLIREFARNVVSIRAASGRAPLAIVKRDKHTWQVEPCRGALTVTIEVYAWDLSVRGAHLDTTHGFFNGPSVFLRVAGQEAARGLRQEIATLQARFKEAVTVLRRMSTVSASSGVEKSGRCRPGAMACCAVGSRPRQAAVTGGHSAMPCWCTAAMS